MLLTKYNLTRNFVCSICKIAFVKMQTLEIHCRLKHANECPVDEPLKIQQNYEDSSPKEWKCSVCDKIILSRVNGPHLQEFTNGSKSFQCDSCKLSPTESCVDHTKLYRTGNLKCLPYAKTQEKLPKEKEIFNCSQWGTSHNNEIALKHHTKEHLDEEKKHKCDFCEKRFLHASDKQKHIRIHTGEKPFKCNHCNKSFTHLTSYKNHLLIHSDRREFQCTICGKTFKHKSNLNVHNRNHTGARPFKCTDCSKSFFTSGHLKDHIRIHQGERNYQCNLCGKKFLHRSSFKKHLLAHSGDRPFHCEICEKRFTQQNHLITHLRIHTGEKPFKCEICEKAFNRSDSLRSHERVHSKKL